MNELTQRFIDAFLPYLKPESRDRHRRDVLEAVEERGEIVKIEEERYCAGERRGRVSRRIYHHANGRYGVLHSIRVGVQYLHEPGDTTPPPPPKGVS